jgi:hypothetical protein
MIVPLPPVSVRTLLLDASDGTDDFALLDKALSEHGVLAGLKLGPTHLAEAVKSSVCSEVARVAADFLELDLGDLVLAGWRKRTELIKAARRTTEEPGSSELVPIAAHQATATYHPAIDIKADDVLVHTIKMELNVVLGTEGLLVSIRHGHLMKIRCARSTVTATFIADGFELAHKERAFDIGGAIRLGRTGIPLVGTVHPMAADNLVRPGQTPVAGKGCS